MYQKNEGSFNLLEQAIKKNDENVKEYFERRAVKEGYDFLQKAYALLDNESLDIEELATLKKYLKDESNPKKSTGFIEFENGSQQLLNITPKERDAYLEAYDNYIEEHSKPADFRKALESLVKHVQDVYYTGITGHIGATEELERILKQAVGIADVDTNSSENNIEDTESRCRCQLF